MSERDLDASYWQNRYEQALTGWDRGGPSPAATFFLEWAQREGWRRVLVPGCGRGHEVITLAEAGLEVTAIDFAPSAVDAVNARLKERNLKATVRAADVLEISFESPFDAVYEQTCLCALPPDAWERYEAQLYRWLRPNGVLFAMFMQTTQPNGPPFRCPLGVMRQLFSAERWEWGEIVGRIDHQMPIHEWACPLRRIADSPA